MTWNAALQKLSKGDHYLLVLINRANPARRSASSYLKMLLSALVLFVRGWVDFLLSALAAWSLISHILTFHTVETLLRAAQGSETILSHSGGSVQHLMSSAPTPLMKRGLQTNLRIDPGKRASRHACVAAGPIPESWRLSAHLMWASAIWSGVLYS
jgi:hypothetical protein